MAQPFNVAVMDVNAFVDKHRILQVTTALIKEPSTNEFHPDGLFSEEIFGRIGTIDRMTTHGYIELNTKIIAPVLFKTLTRLGSFYIDLMAGRVYATWNPEEANFERVYEDPEEVEGADTGFSFFLKYFPQIKFNLTESLIREARVDLLNEYRSIGLYDKYLVMPAGLRDIQSDTGGKLIQDDLNKIYTTLLAYTGAIPPHTTSSLYDGVRFNVQSKANEIYEHIDNMMTGKRGFLQGSIASRKIVGGTRNVITSASYVARRPDDPQALKPNETGLGVFQTMKAFQPCVFFQLKTLFFSRIFGDDTTSYNVPLINPKTFRLEYQEITDDEKQKWISPDGINTAINRFINIDVRGRPMIARNKDNQPFYVMLVYDDGDRISFFRSIDDLKNLMGSYDKSKIRPMTWIEACYVATELAVHSRWIHITRYPVLGDGSVYPSRVHLYSTIPGRVVSLVDLEDITQTVRQFAEYPILGNAYQDTMVLSHAALRGLGADFDGDMSSANASWSVEANQECEDYYRSNRSILDTQRRMVIGGVTDTGNLAIYNWTY